MLLLSLSVLSAVSAAPTNVDIGRMWSQLNAHCAAGRCELAEGSKLSDIANTTGEPEKRKGNTASREMCMQIQAHNRSMALI